MRRTTPDRTRPADVAVESTEPIAAPDARVEPGATRDPADGQPTAADDGATRPSDEEVIRWRAYELYLARGDSGGDAESDWFAAEREVRPQNALGGPSAAEPSER